MVQYSIAFYLLGTFIKKIIDTLVGQKGRRAKDSLTSVTQDLTPYRILDHERYGSHIVLVDTPGFDDTKRTDVHILELIGKWLEKTYVKLDLWNQYYPDNIYADIRNKYYCRGSCTCTESPMSGCPQNQSRISTCSKNSLVPEVPRMSSSPPRCGINSTGMVMEINERRT